VTQKTFFEKLDVLAGAPDSLAKIRALVLEWAVRGRLVPQDKSEEPARQLLERVASISTTGTRRIDGQDIISRPFKLPASWEWVVLPRVLKKLTDGTHHSPPNGPTGEFLYVTAKNIKSDGVLLDDITYVSKDVHDEIYSRCDPNFGDILYIKDGATTGIATINDLVVPFSMLSSVALLKPSEVIFNRYLLWAMRSPFFYAETRDSMKGAAITRVTLSVMAASLIPLPPLAEQKRIVMKVDELMALCDRLEAQQKHREEREAGLARASMARFAQAPTSANLNFLFHKSYDVAPADLRKSILSLAVQGKLVPQDPNDEPAERSLRKLASVAIQADDDLYPPNWLRVPLGKTGEWRGGGTPSKSRADYWEGDMPWVSPKDMKVLRINDAQDHISESAVEGSAVRKIPAGSLLMVVRGMILARAFPVAITTRQVTINQDMKALIPLEPETVEFLLMALRAFEPQVLATIERSTHGTCKLQTGVLESLAIPVPPLAEQRRIVAKVDTLIEQVNELEIQIAKAHASGRDLLEAVVAELSI
jgi:type I restriction enzyme S subunit